MGLFFFVEMRCTGLVHAITARSVWTAQNVDLGRQKRPKRTRNLFHSNVSPALGETRGAGDGAPVAAAVAKFREAVKCDTPSG